ncbi:UbiX family flavin prenyltransferase [Fundidesulfovibrio soli]|uniref:UbiX family flavin prenyltransferase n=1 Tax=Fundidesulfovibrio soli TaxID=2922716 RepID=UPI001FAE8134|nr:UbiX family flavin prenyltransferase [Fundidesulfovibrio soli]
MIVKRIVLALTGASGMPYAVALARAIASDPSCELHLILSDAAIKVLELESKVTAAQLIALASAAYTQHDVAAGPASGSWRHAGMIVCPCSMASLAAISNGLGSNLIHRAADVTLKEGRKLVLVPRETPFNEIHLRNMLAAKQAGASILAACPGFYGRPATIDDLADFIAARALDLLGIPHSLGKRWKDDN